MPKKEIRRETKTGGGPFWKNFWIDKVSENSSFYKKQYKKRVEKQKNKIESLKEINKRGDKRVYVDVILSDEKKSSKSNIPSKLWEESGLEIVATKEEEGVTILTLGGKKDEYKALEEIIESSNFEIAQKDSGAKDTTIARELYAVTDIQNKSNTPDGRISKPLIKLLNSDHSENIDCIIEIHSDIKFSEYDSIYDEITEKINPKKIIKRDLNLFIHNVSYYADLTETDIFYLLSEADFSFISKIKLNPSFSAQRSTPSQNFNNIKVGKILTNETVGLIDSGVKNIHMDPFIKHSLNYLENGLTTDVNHGTNVASRLLFGEKFFEQIQRGDMVYPSVNIVDIKVLHKKNNGEFKTSLESLMKAIKETPNKVSEITIFNLSISTIEPLDDDSHFDELTELIDTISSEKDVLFVIAAGNHMENLGLDYLENFNLDDSFANITAPADSINSISVGSISRVANNDTICNTENFPAPFTRKGGIRKDMKKPELVCGGGNIQIDRSGNYDLSHLDISKNTYGEDVLEEYKFGKEIGTSLSAPIIAKEAALLLDYLKKSNLPETVEHFSTNKSNLIRAILIHSASKKKQVKINNDGVKRAFGFGEADFEKGILDSSESEVSIVYANRISDKEKKHKLDLKIPEEFVGKDIEVSLTLAYNPPVNKNIKEYKLIKLHPSLGLAKANFNEKGEIEEVKIDRMNPQHSWKNYISNPFSSLVHFKKKIRKLKSIDLELLVTMTISDFLDKEVGSEEIHQDYAFIFSIRDIEDQNILRSRLVQENELQELIQIPIEVSS